MPCETMPRSLAFLIFRSSGMRAPTVASGAFIPAQTLGAPQTICKGPSSPAATWHTCNLSASGCASTDSTSATTTPLKPPATGSTESTSRPAIVSCSASCWVSSPGLTHSRNQPSLNFIIRTLSPYKVNETAAGSVNRSRRTAADH